MIRERRRVASLVLGHNDLGDDGCKELFRFLSSEDGQKYQIQEISLNANHITDKGLEYMAEFLDGNRHLKQLFLQNVRLISVIASSYIYLTTVFRTYFRSAVS